MNPDDKEETKMKTKMKVAVCTLLCMMMACAAANAEGGTTNSTNSGRPQTQQSQMKNRKKKGMQQKLNDQNVPKDMPSCVDTRKLLEDGVIDEDTYNAIEEYLKENAPEKPEGEQDDTQQPPEKPEDEADDDSADQPELPEIGGGEVQLKSLLDAGVITQQRKNKIQSGGVGYKYSHKSARKLPRVSSNHQKG